MSHDAQASTQVLALLERYGGEAPYTVLYRYMHRYYPDPIVFEGVLRGMMEAQLIGINKSTGTVRKL